MLPTFVVMKRSTIWMIAILTGVAFLALLFLQTRYFSEVISMRQDQFTKSVTRALYQTSRQLELKETQDVLNQVLESKTGKSELNDSKQQPVNNFPAHTIVKRSLPSDKLVKYFDENVDATKKQLRDSMQNAYLNHKELLEQSVYRMLYLPGGKDVSQKLNNLENVLGRSLANYGINGEDLTYHYCVINAVGDTVSACADYSPEGDENSFKQVLFPEAATAGRGVLYVHFPNQHRYIFAEARLMMPALIFTILLLCIFIFTIYTILKQKRLTEMKSDFINNMTHEFKTPISSISLAAQMLNDDGVKKSENMYKHLSSVINDETKRLRFQVEKVLQMSMFEKNAGTFNFKEISINALIADVANTFRLKVETNGGRLITDLQAQRDKIYADHMHITNVVFNLMDNAVKYKQADEPLVIEVKSYNKNNHVIVSIRDNGIGIKKEDLKKIFEKFYRAHTGNRHDVKGFGLGLAYVNKIIQNHNGNIHAESVYGKGTEFIISLPIV